MKGGYAPVSQTANDENDIDSVFHKHKGGGRAHWKYFYLLLLLLLGIGAGVAAWYLKDVHSNKIVLKPLYDRKLYKALTLKNGMHVLLIEDRKTLLSGVGLDLQVSYMVQYYIKPGIS